MKKQILVLLGFILFCSTTKAQVPATTYKYKINNNLGFDPNNSSRAHVSHYFIGSMWNFGSGGVGGFSVRGISDGCYGNYGYFNYYGNADKPFDGVISWGRYLKFGRYMEQSKSGFNLPCIRLSIQYETKPLIDNSQSSQVVLQRELMGIEYGIQNNQTYFSNYYYLSDGLDLSTFECFLIDQLNISNQNSNLANISVCRPLKFNVIKSDYNPRMTFAIDAKLGIDTENNPYVEIYPYTKQETQGIDMSLEKLKEKGLNLDPYQSFTIRVRYSSAAMTELNTEKITYKYVECAPEIAASTTTATTCNDAKDGKVVLELKRKFRVDENISVETLKTTTGRVIAKFNAETPEGYKFNNVTTNAAYDIFEISNLDAGNYNFTYNTINGGVLTQDITHPFTISAPMPLKFIIKKADNPKCKDDLVEIAIEVIGGTGSYKFYVDDNLKTAIKKEDNLYYLTGLKPSDTNNIKVTDANDCIEK